MTDLPLRWSGAIIAPPSKADAMADPTCKHPRRRLIAKDQDAEYVECEDCGAILEADELEGPASGFDESLSDA
jgi:hypothetical protein